MILFRYLLREVTQNMLAMIVALLVIMLSITFVRYLSQVAGGGLPLSAAFALIGILLPRFLSMLIPISFFLSIVLVYGKLFANSELRVMFACGLSWWRLSVYTLIPGLVLSIIVAVLSLYAVPKMYYYKDNLAAIASVETNALSLANTGEFIPFGGQVAYIGRIDHKTGVSHEIFLYQKLPNQQVRIILAPTGQMVKTNHGTALNLDNGRVYQGEIGQKDFKIVQFKHYQLLTNKTIDGVNHSGIKAESTLKLLQNPSPVSLTEFQWRIMFPITTIILALLGVGLCYITPRRGRYAKLFNAFLVFILYFNAMTILKTWMDNGAWPIGFGFGVIVVLFGGAAFILLMRLEGQWKMIQKRFLTRKSVCGS